MTELNLAAANIILNAALQEAGSKGYRPMSAVVLDAGGHLVAMQRQDGASMFRADIATGKAWAAVAMGVHSRALMKRAADNPSFFGALASTGQGKFIPQVGGVLVKDAEGNILGAVGASGGTGDEDEAICIHGIVTAGLKAD
ncbi:heme-binding protein [Duganella sp. BuS-21]|uniref:GlcG/HbpS family heme-binding protein n=1 Tax=Duganella sp. BuS-21 TaxID=2943848 RepID=UPI0035A6FE07